jgi:hypothetical protein
VVNADCTSGTASELLHGAMRVSNILFNGDRQIQIPTPNPVRLETGEVEQFSGEKLPSKVYVLALPAAVPGSVSWVISRIAGRFVVHHSSLGLKRRNKQTNSNAHTPCPYTHHDVNNHT